MSAVTVTIQAALLHSVLDTYITSTNPFDPRVIDIDPRYYSHF